LFSDFTGPSSLAESIEAPGARHAGGASAIRRYLNAPDTPHLTYGGTLDTDVPTVLSFLRSDLSTRLDPGASVSWALRLGRQPLRAGPATVSIWGPVVGTQDLVDSHFTVYDVRAALSVTLRRSGRCYLARPR
jgi:hypothetical protein